MKYLSSLFVFCGIIAFILLSDGYKPKPKSTVKTSNNRLKHSSVIDEYKGVKVYYNGGISKTYGRNLTKDGYNLGLKWQCVEFVKRFYYEKYHHKMPNSYGHAKDFYNKGITNNWNKERALYQFQNGNRIKPKSDMILVFDGNDKNTFGHIAVITKVNQEKITVVQQNWGTQSRMTLPLVVKDGLYHINHPDVLGWLSL